MQAIALSSRGAHARAIPRCAVRTGFRILAGICGGATPAVHFCALLSGNDDATASDNARANNRLTERTSWSATRRDHATAAPRLLTKIRGTCAAASFCYRTRGAAHFDLLKAGQICRRKQLLSVSGGLYAVIAQQEGHDSCVFVRRECTGSGKRHRLCHDDA